MMRREIKVTAINWDVFMEINARAAMRRLEAEKKETSTGTPPKEAKENCAKQVGGLKVHGIS